MSQGRRLLERCLKPLGMRLDDVRKKYESGIKRIWF